MLAISITLSFNFAILAIYPKIHYHLLGHAEVVGHTVDFSADHSAVADIPDAVDVVDAGAADIAGRVAGTAADAADVVDAGTVAEAVAVAACSLPSLQSSRRSQVRVQQEVVEAVLPQAKRHGVATAEV